MNRHEAQGFVTHCGFCKCKLNYDFMACGPTKHYTDDCCYGCAEKIMMGEEP